MNCSACGVAIPSDSTFCPKCGAKSGAASAVNSGVSPAKKLFSPSGGGDDAETALWSGSYSGKAMVGSWILAVIISIGLGVAGAFIPPAIPVVIVVGVVLWVILLFVLVYRKLSVRYELSSQRFIHKKGILSQRTDRIEVIDIDDVTVLQGIVERMLGVGTIKIVSTDRTDPELVLRGIDRVSEIANLMDDARRAERRKRGVHVESI